MNFNPIGYRAYTANGNDYQKSNLGKTGALLTVGAADVLLNTAFKNKDIVKKNNTENFIKEVGKLVGKEIKLGKKGLLAAKVAGFAIDALAALGIGALIDKAINNSRAKKADAKAAENYVE